MLIDLLQSVNKIYLAYGATDFRKQISSLCSIIKDNFKMNPYDKSAYIFCNKKRGSSYAPPDVVILRTNL